MASTAYFLETARLGFRAWQARDLDLAVGLWGDPRVMEKLDARGGLTRSEVEERLARERESQKRSGLQYWPIFLLESGEHVGCCGLRPRDPARGIHEIGFHILFAHWRRGYAREAAEAVIAHAFRGLDAKGLFAGHHPDNVASRRLLLSLGFRYTHDELYPPMGSENPSYLLTSDEYSGRAGGV